MAEALYRKYRPQVFSQMVGQEHIQRTLRNAIEQNKVSHAYLFTGPRGTGKTTTARLLAKALLCDNGPTPDPCGVCENCQDVALGAHPDVYELDAASRRGVDNVREEIIGRVQFAPTRGRSKVYIIDEVHMLTTEAFNALLKTLEEPPEHVVFILCTTDPQKVPETIHSRCQRFDFHRISNETLVSHLGYVCGAEGVEFDGEALDIIAHRADGGMRNALTSLEQLIAFGEGKVTKEVAARLLGSVEQDGLSELVVSIGKRDVAACFTWTERYVETGADLAQFAQDLATYFRNLYVLSLTDAEVDLGITETTRAQMAEQLTWFGVDRLSRLLEVCSDVIKTLRTSTDPRLDFEIALTRMVRPKGELTLMALAERIEELEHDLEQISSHKGEKVPRMMNSAGALASQVPVGPAVPVSASIAAGASVPQTMGASVGGVPAVASNGASSRPVTPPIPAAEPALAPSPAAAADSVPMPVPAAEPALSPASEAEPVSTPAPATEPTPVPAATPASINETAAFTVAPSAPMAASPEQSPQSTAAVGPMDPVSSAPIAAPAANTAQNGLANASEASVQTAAPASSIAGSSVNLSDPSAVQRLWRSVTAQLRKENPPRGVLFMSTQARPNSQGPGIEVVFAPESSFAYRAANKPEVLSLVQETLQAHTGVAVPLTMTMDQQVAMPAPSATGTSPVAAAPSAFGEAHQVPSPQTETLSSSALDSAPFSTTSSSPVAGASSFNSPASSSAAESVISAEAAIPDVSSLDHQGVSASIEAAASSAEPMPWDEIPPSEVTPWDEVTAPSELMPWDEAPSEASFTSGSGEGGQYAQSTQGDGASFQHASLQSTQTSQVPSVSDQSFSDGSSIDSQQDETAYLKQILVSSFGEGIRFEDVE